MDNQSPTFGGQHSQDHPYYAPDQCPYQQQSLMDPLEYQQSEQVNYVMGTEVYREDVVIVPPPTSRKGKEKKVSRRGGGFTKEEDQVLCSAFLNVGKDPITGANRTLGGYYRRFHDYYNTFKPEGSNRSQLAVQNRWGTIQRSVSKFCGFKSAIDRHNDSGKNEQDRIDDAVKMYEAEEPFHFMHCWKILRNEAKWNDKLLNNSAGTCGEGSSQANSGHDVVPEGGNENSMPASSEGRDSAKRKRVTDSSSSSIAVDVLQRIQDSVQDNREKKVSRRGGGFTKEEDQVLCSAFLNVGKNPITGANRILGGYYRRFHDYYNTFKPEGSNRSQLAVQNRWGTIQRSVSKFCLFKSVIDRRNDSGKNEQDRIDDAVKMYEAEEPFHFMHCWKILRNEAKWNDKLLNNSAGTCGEGSSQANSGHDAVPEGGNGNSMPASPEGRDSAKRKRVTDSSSSSIAVDVLQRIQDNREKKVSRRGGGFTKEEDQVLCSAFLNVGKNPITGANRILGGYYRRFHDYYNTFKPDGSNRSQLAVQNRWGTIQRSVSKFCLFKSVIDRRNDSGKNEQDRIDDAVKMYEAEEPFHFMHCWKILQNEAKWNAKLLNNSAGTRGEGSSQASSGHDAVPEGGNENSMPARPEGRDSAKRKRVIDTSSSSIAVDVLQRIHDNREKCQQKEDEQMVQILTRKDEKLNLQREFLDLKKQQHEENLILRQQEAKNAAMQAEAQLLSAEATIMSVDIDKVAPHLKNYYIGMQRQIMNRRGFT